MAGDLLIGMMSGTSVDGIDAALVRFESAEQLQLIATRFTPFEDALRDDINRLAQHVGRLKPADYAALDRQLAEAYAEAAMALADEAGILMQDLRAIANHGQTVSHEPNIEQPYTLQLGDPQTIADICGATTIAQFRQADMAVGGQGAPLMPAFHHAMFARSSSATAILNIGGIANLTVLGEPVIGFDTGPGNTLMDQWIEQNESRRFDKNGEWAASGVVDEAALKLLLADPYFTQTAPKTTGTDVFSLAWVERTLGDLSQFKAPDLQATLLALTVESIAHEIERAQQTTELERICVCGGGASNHHLMNSLRKRLPELTIQTTDDLGIAADWLEAIGFAWLGYCRLEDIPGNLPSVTGAREAVVLGEVFEPHGGFEANARPV
ncbi:MAG: anhydro-N-acetylmuramic acid kinase [Gammaproteobacteria bacterium]|nr:anhydro-N-acetylmuramic acid kinase [Gammaproteobacteria bacterium]